MPKEVIVLRYGHRHVRDYRVTSHCCLVARAFGADKIEIVGEQDTAIERTVSEMNERWGSGARVEFVGSWNERLAHYNKLGFTSVHLTMYGVPIQDAEKGLAGKDKLLVIIGSQKVEREVYEKSDYNVSITLQPHSEIAALAVFMDRIFDGQELSRIFPKAKIAVEPRNKGKKVRKV
ncbi:MAG: tRNA (cytidine(56)-2'-O)-methyltransferase [Candidatus Diapherotrites archaeon]|uniref:tRNA (cytidine(56)-2'-O)-methyltransferase n=1 Tax=Candidatus Iainarchaeum sp. TaxID=3101447 RepID=A0A8T3YM67_9ARCH|nr:tRNA (cytidine(56)-2'-O)-methyltransferase [Candidatus Diapherotrites archaeon]